MTAGRSSDLKDNIPCPFPVSQWFMHGTTSYSDGIVQDSHLIPYTLLSVTYNNLQRTNSITGFP